MGRANILILLKRMIYHDLISTDLEFGLRLNDFISNIGSGHSEISSMLELRIFHCNSLISILVEHYNPITFNLYVGIAIPCF